MGQKIPSVISERADDEGLKNLSRIKNRLVIEFVERYVAICNPRRVHILGGSKSDLQFVRDMAIKNKEESPLAIKGHTIHFDGYYDQARDKATTKFLLPPGKVLGKDMNSMDRGTGLREIHQILQDIMRGRDLYVKFYCLGPTGSVFSIPCLQITDSAYVAHSEDLLYRQGYKEFLRMKDKTPFWKFLHTQGGLVPAGLGLGVSKDLGHRRVYMDLEEETIYSTNTQYGGNVIGLKKLAMRLGINRASKEGWLTEHMLVMGVRGPGRAISYFTGAFPSMCGKTSTAMLDGETIVGDDIAYLRVIGGKVRAVNVERGLFGIIEGINSKDDHLQWKALHTENDIIFSNVLVKDDGTVYWNGKDGGRPAKGVNHSGQWFAGKKDAEEQEIPASHKNARFTIGLETLENLDRKWDDPDGVAVSGIVYGGRDSDTSVPVAQAFDWRHGIVIMGAGLESETTAATLGKEGVRAFNPMSNLDFLSIPIGRYIQDNLDFGEKAKVRPAIFSVNYFLRDADGKWLNQKNDKRIWLKWMAMRVRDKAKAITTPIGHIPLYKDLKQLFKSVQGLEFTQEAYDKQFLIRIPQNLEKLDRLTKIYRERVSDTPVAVFEELEAQRKRLELARERFGDNILPGYFLKK